MTISRRTCLWNNLLAGSVLLFLLFGGGCNQQMGTLTSRVPGLVARTANEDFAKDVTVSEVYDIVSALPAIQLVVTTEPDIKADKRGEIQHTIEEILKEQLTASSVVLSDRAKAKLNVHIVHIGVPLTRKRTGEIKLAKVRLGAWITLADTETPVFQSVIDGVVFSGPSNPSRSVYAKAGQTAISKLVRRIKRIPESTIERKANVKWLRAERTRIVSVGISHYEDRSIPPVTYASNDARAVVEFARGAGVPRENITLLVEKQATRTKIIKAIKELETRTDESDEMAMFYFSGHGVPLLAENKKVEGVLVPYDASIDSDDNIDLTCIKQEYIRDKLGELEGKGLIILDACFSGKADNQKGLVAKGAKGVAGISNPFKPKSNLWYMTATSGNHYANEYDKERRGLFTYYFLEALEGATGVDKDANGTISLNEVFDWTRRRVEYTAEKNSGRRQVPELISGEGNIVFTKLR